MTTVLANVFTGISYVFVMVLISWKLAMITFLFIPAYIIWIAYISVKLEILAEKQQISKDSLLKEVNNYISSKEVIKIFNFFRIVVQSFDKVIIKNKRLNIKMLTYQNFINIVSGVIVTAASVVPLLVGVNLVKGGNMTIGDLIAFNSYSGLLFSPITQLIGTLANVRVANVYKTRIEAFDFQHEARKIKNVDDNITEIKLENLSIYSEKQLILKGINLNIHNGDWVRLYGANGSGKSLFLKTVAKLYTDYKGEISINSEVNSTIVNKKIVYISSIHGFPLQNLYQEMTASNTVDHIEIVNVLKLVGLSDKISHLKENIFTSNSEIVEKFSTGELQKLRLARALIRKPDFLFLDEIFSNIELTQAVDILKNTL
ncbi:ABC transporter transmembrane domain-containing protein [Enterococcus termitis]